MLDNLKPGCRVCLACWAFLAKTLRLHLQDTEQLFEAFGARLRQFGLEEFTPSDAHCPLCRSAEGFKVTEQNHPVLLLALARACRRE